MKYNSMLCTEDLNSKLSLSKEGKEICAYLRLPGQELHQECLARELALKLFDTVNWVKEYQLYQRKLSSGSNVVVPEIMFLFPGKTVLALWPDSVHTFRVLIHTYKAITLFRLPIFKLIYTWLDIPPLSLEQARGLAGGFLSETDDSVHSWAETQRVIRKKRFGEGTKR